MLGRRGLDLVVALVLLLVVTMGSDARAISIAPFTSSGTYSRPPGPPSFQIGSGGFVEEIDAFLARAGDAVAAQLSQQSPPAGLALGFSSMLSTDTTDLLLRYDVVNTSAAAISGITFLSFFDAEIDESLNTFFNEYAETEGALAAGRDYEVDEPGFAFGDIVSNARAASLDGTNAVPIGAPDDVSMALSFALGPLNPGQTARFEILLSEDGDAIGGFAIRQRDVDARSRTVITYSGTASVVTGPGPVSPVPEPGAALVFGAGLALVAALRKQ
jgi:hypothetical protein